MLGTMLIFGTGAAVALLAPLLLTPGDGRDTERPRGAAASPARKITLELIFPQSLDKGATVADL
jgi:hypothetical protein